MSLQTDFAAHVDRYCDRAIGHVASAMLAMASERYDDAAWHVAASTACTSYVAVAKGVWVVSTAAQSGSYSPD